MDLTNHTTLPPQCISHEEPSSPDILIQTKKTVVYLDTFTPISSLVNNPVYPDYETDSSSNDIESEEEDPLMVKPLPARGIPPAQPTIVPQNYIKKYPNTKYDKHSYAYSLKKELKKIKNNKREIAENLSFTAKEINEKSDTSLDVSSKDCNRSCEVHPRDVRNEDLSTQLEKSMNSINDTIESYESCLKMVPCTNLKDRINDKISNEKDVSVSITSSPCHSPSNFDECFSPKNEMESERSRKNTESEGEKKEQVEKDLIKMKQKKDYSCNRQDCSFVAVTRKALYCHKREKHRNSRDFLCTVCPFRTSFASDLKKHSGTHVPVVAKCPYKDCEYVGKHSNSLDYHKRKVHPTGSPLHCSIPGCQYSTFLPSNLKVHQIKNHGSGKTISCDQCSYRCYLIAELRKHLRTHSSETPYACDFPNCQYACKISSNLRKHKRIHTEERPYACDVCAFRSNFISSLKAHKRIHTDERPYCCEQCGYRCNSASNLKKHIVQRHPGTVYEIQKDNGVLNKGRKKIEQLVTKIGTPIKSATNMDHRNSAVEQLDINEMEPSVAPLHFSSSQDLFYHNRMQQRSLNS